MTFFIYFIIQNVLAGALFSPFLATILLATLTMVGSACATLLSKPLGPFLAHLSPAAIDMTRAALSGSYHDIPESETELRPKSSSAWIRLSVLRLIGVVPWSGINIACGVCNVRLTDCMLGAFIGCLPWTAVTCQVCRSILLNLCIPCAHVLICRLGISCRLLRLHRHRLHKAYSHLLRRRKFCLSLCC